MPHMLLRIYYSAMHEVLASLFSDCVILVVHSPPRRSFLSETVAKRLGLVFLSLVELWGIWRTKMAATVAGVLPQAQNQGKQQAGSASDRSLRSVFGTLRLRAHIFSYILNNDCVVDS